jgi:hypothetical protein
LIGHGEHHDHHDDDPGDRQRNCGLGALRAYTAHAWVIHLEFPGAVNTERFNRLRRTRIQSLNALSDASCEGITTRNARWLDRSLQGDAYVTFTLGADGEVEAIRMKVLSPDTDFSFDFHHLDLRRVVDE